MGQSGCRAPERKDVPRAVTVCLGSARCPVSAPPTPGQGAPCLQPVCSQNLPRENVNLLSPPPRAGAPLGSSLPHRIKPVLIPPAQEALWALGPAPCPRKYRPAPAALQPGALPCRTAPGAHAAPSKRSASDRAHESVSERTRQSDPRRGLLLSGTFPVGQARGVGVALGPVAFPSCVSGSLWSRKQPHSRFCASSPCRQPPRSLLPHSVVDTWVPKQPMKTARRKGGPRQQRDGPGAIPAAPQVAGLKRPLLNTDVKAAPPAPHPVGNRNPWLHYDVQNGAWRRHQNQLPESSLPRKHETPVHGPVSHAQRF